MEDRAQNKKKIKMQHHARVNQLQQLAAKVVYTRYTFYILLVVFGLVSCCPICRHPPAFVRHGFRSIYVVPPPRIHSARFPSAPGLAPSPPFPLDTFHGGWHALPTQLCLVVAPPHHEPYGCFKDTRLPLSRLFCDSGPQIDDLNSNTKRRFSADPSVVWDSLGFSTQNLCQVLKSSARFLDSLRQPSSRSFPDRLIAPFIAEPRHPQRRAAVFEWLFRRSRNVSSRWPSRTRGWRDQYRVGA